MKTIKLLNRTINYVRLRLIINQRDLPLIELSDKTTQIILKVGKTNIH